MADYYAKIIQNNLSLEIEENNLPYQFSSDIPIMIKKDTDNFVGYQLLPFFVHSNTPYLDAVSSNSGVPIKYDEETEIAILPNLAFKKKGYLFISVCLKEVDGDKIIYSGTVRMNIKESVGGDDTIPAESVWVDAITKYVDTYMNEKYKPTYDALLENAEDLQGQAESLHNTVTQQQQNINNTLQTTQGLQENIEEINETTEQLQQTTTQLQNNVNLTVQKATQQQDQIDNAIDVMGDYEVVQDNPTQIRFKKGDGTYGDTVNLGDNLASKSMVNAGYDTYSGNSYSGSASDYGIEIGKASGNYEQEGTPTPESPVEPKFFEPKHVNTNGGNLFDASKIPTNTKNNVTVINNDDGSFTINGNGIVPAQTSFGTCTIRNLKKGTLYIKSDAYVCPYLYVDIYWGDVWKKVATNAGSLLTTIEITQEDIDNGAEARVYFKTNSAQSIKTGTVQPVIYQDGDGTWYPFNADSTPLDITLRALPGGVCDTYENGVITRRVGYIEFDGSEDEDFIFRNQAESPLVQIYVNGAKGNTNNQSLAGYLCNKLKELTPDNLCSSIEVNRFSIGVNDGSKCFFSFRVDGVTESIESFKTWLQSNPIKVWYELAEPHTEQVDLPVIPSYFPFTNAWHDSEVEASDLTWHINTYARNNEYTDEFLQKFFALQRTGKVYTVRFPLFSKSTSPTGEKMDHNEGLTCEPSTDTIIGQDDYQDIPLFKTYDVNAYSDDNGRIHVTAFKGDKYFKDTGKVDVFVLGMSYYEKYWEDDNYWYYSRTDMPRNGYTLCAECRNTDGSKSSYALYSKYVSGEIDGKPYSSKGLIPKRNMSYNVCESYYHSRGKNYGGSPMYLYKYLMTTFYLKYATLNTQSKIYGCFNYSYQYAASMAENNVKRIVLTTAQAANIVVGSYVSIGDKGSNSSVDRGNSYMHNKAEEVEVISKTTVDDSHVAINVDSPTSFNTTTTTYLSTMHWKSGFSDNVLGRDGSIGDLTSGKYPMVFQGIELAVGGYEVAGNAFMDIVNSTGKRDIYVTNDNSKITTNVADAKSMYNKSKNSSQPTTLSAWNYITKMALDEENGMFNVIECGNSGSGSVTGFCDGFYVDSATSGQREFLLLGYLGHTAFGGLSCVYAYYSLSSADWDFLARLSISGRKG